MKVVIPKEIDVSEEKVAIAQKMLIDLRN